MGPDEFIPLAEESGAILALGRAVLFEACREAATWRSEPGNPLLVTVNLSAAQLGQDEFVPDVVDILRATGLPASRLVLEMTETVMFHDTTTTIARLTALRDLGVRVAIDDFGTGYSSLGYLRRFPVDILKIAREFIAPADAGPDGWAFAHAIVALGRTLGLRIVAEGIEELAQLEQLRDLGCELGQGFLFARPMPGEDIAELFAEPRAHPAVTRYQSVILTSEDCLNVHPVRAAASASSWASSPAGESPGWRPCTFRWAGAIVLGLVIQVVLFTDAVAARVGDLGPVDLRRLDGARAGGRGPQPCDPRDAGRGGRGGDEPGRDRGQRRVHAGRPSPPWRPWARSEPAIYSNSSVVPEPALWFLTDIFAMPAGIPFANVFSPGDVVIGIGIAIVIVVAMRRSAAPVATTAAARASAARWCVRAMTRPVDAWGPPGHVDAGSVAGPL